MQRSSHKRLTIAAITVHDEASRAANVRLWCGDVGAKAARGPRCWTMIRAGLVRRSCLGWVSPRSTPHNAPWYARLGFVIDETDGVVAWHMQQEQPYGGLAPRVVMSRPLGTPAASRLAAVTGDQ